MTHVEPFAAWVGKHVEHIEFWLSRVESGFTWIGSMKNTALLPVLAPLGFKYGKWKLLSALAHCKILYRLSQRLLISGSGFPACQSGLKGGGNFEVVT